MQQILRDALAGAAGGLAGTLAMTAVMGGAREAGLLGEPPPKTITDRMLRDVGLGGLEREEKNAVALAGHVAYGIGVGALLGVALRRLPDGVPPAAAGAALGLAVWTASYAGWVPALGLMPPPHRHKPGQPESMIAAHLVYGAVSGAVATRVAA